MLTIDGMRVLSLFTSLHSLRHCRHLTQGFPSFRNLSSTSWPLFSILKLRDPIKFDQCFLRPSVNYFSSRPRPSEDDIKINKMILSLKTVEKQLELFESIKDSANIVNIVTILHNIAKITQRDEKQKQVLEQEKDKSRQALKSAYVALLDSISKDISKCDHRSLTNVLWALGQVQEKDHKLVEVCEKVIESRDITAFNNVDIGQIANGCVNLNLKATEISSRLQESIRNGQVQISKFENRQLSAVLMLFAKTDGCFAELFNIFLEEILSRDFLLMDSTELAQFVWSFAKKDVKADELFNRVEEESLRRGTTDLKRRDFFQILWAFGKTEKGSTQLFHILENELVIRGEEGFNNAELLEIIGMFARRNMTNAKVFDLVKEEVFNRGFHMFQIHELVLILYYFVSAQRQDNELVKEIESELLTRDLRQIYSGHLCQVAWCLGRARRSDSKLFDVIEEAVFHRGLHQFSKVQKFMLLRGYIEAERGSTKFYNHLQSSLSKNDFSDFTARNIYDFAWCFSEREVNTGPLFNALEREILNKGKDGFSQMQLASIKKSFQKVGKGTKELFEL